MPIGNMKNYQGSLGALDVIDDGFNKWIKVYNDLGSAVNNGDVYFLDFKRDADSRAVPAYPTLEATATSAVYRQVVVVDNSPLGLTSIADADFGYVQVAGYCAKVAVAAGVNAADRFIQGANASAVGADDGTSITTDSFATSVTAYDSGYCTAMLFGQRSLIG